MNKELIAFLDEEISISEYKILSLGRGDSKPYKDRLISVEREFLNFDFKKINAKDTDELRHAIALFRTDRSAFDRIYNEDCSSRDDKQTAKMLSSSKRKIVFYRKLYKYLLDVKLSDTSTFAFKDPTRSGVLWSKDVARRQILIYSFARNIYHELASVEADFDISKITKYFEAKKIKDRLDNLFDLSLENIFKHYNSGITEVPLLTDGTSGQNDYIPSIYPLVNLSRSLNSDAVIKRVLDHNKVFFTKAGTIVDKKFVKRGFSVITNMARTGNETLDLLYLNIYSKSGTCLDSIMTKEFYNLNSDGEYFKAIATIPVWNFDKRISDPYLKREVLSLLSLDMVPLSSDIKFSDKNILPVINSSKNGSIKIDTKESKILIAATRSEMDHIRIAYFWIKLLIKEIKDDYEKRFQLHEISNKSENRKSEYKKYLGNY